MSVADGLFVPDEYKKTKKFKLRLARASGLLDGDLDDFLDTVYAARSRIAHGNAEPPDLSWLHEVVRLGFIGFWGLVELGVDSAEWKDAPLLLS